MKSKLSIFLLTVNFFLSFVVIAQKRFDTSHLNEPALFGQQVAASMETKEVFEFVEKKENSLHLKNGLRASTFINEKEWLSIKDTVNVTSVEIVYSKYPLREGVYHEIYPLLFDRLNALFGMDPDLNDSSIVFSKVLQTHCENDDQVRGLFHGIVIHYETIKDELTNNVSTSKISTVADKIAQQQDEQTSFEDMEVAVENLLESPYLPDTIKTLIERKPLDEQMALLKEFLLEEIENEPDHDLSTSTPEERKKYQGQINYFLSNYSGREPIIEKVFERHPEWKSILVVNDWTGSMYGYGAQVLEWHMKNFERSEIISMTLFNDGDDKPQHLKKPGVTGGIYFEPADNVPQLVDLFNYVMLRGGGGDGPENNIEAILAAIEEYPKFSEIVMIADNNACVRDIELADRIGVPVRVVLCGYDEKRGVNPHYIYLAKVTGGGIYTIEEDLENIDVDLKPGGDIAAFRDKRFKFIKNGCSYIPDEEVSKRIYTLEEGLKNKKEVVRLDASKQNLEKIPRGVYKMDRLSEINLSENKLSELEPKIARLPFLKMLDLSKNSLSSLPLELSYIRYMESLNLSDNQFDSLPLALYSMKNMRHLDLSNNHIQKFDIASMVRLNTLDLSGNGLSEMTKAAGKLKQLRFLDLSDNSLSEVPTAVGSLRKLKELDLSGNHIQTLPNDLRKFINLRTLKLAGNPISEEEKNRIRAALKYTQVTF